MEEKSSKDKSSSGRNVGKQQKSSDNFNAK